MDRILISLKKENSPRASSAPALGLNTIIFKHVYWYMQQTQVSVYRTIGPLVLRCGSCETFLSVTSYGVSYGIQTMLFWKMMLSLREKKCPTST